MAHAATFNGSTFGRWITSPGGRIFRLAAGMGLLGLALARSGTRGSAVTAAAGLLPLTAGAFDLCYLSAVLGGPIRGDGCRADGLAGRRDRSPA